jgi:eukaryotic-like serine/threonine-protein kinase
MPLASGQRLGPYEIVAALGAGGMGEVYRARDSRLGREVALKVLPSGFATDADRLRRFEQEARAAGALNHPNVLAVYDLGTHEGAPYMVTELLEGETLREQLQGSPLPVRKAIGYAVQIAHGLAAAHESGIVHRDLKPDNLFVTRDGRVKVLDFGLAKLSSGPALVESETRTAGSPPVVAMTSPGTVMGTVGYMSPEQVRGLAADARSDIFSFGAILYEMLSGRRAFRGSSAVETMNAILKEDPPDLVATNHTLAPALERIVRHCLEKAPEQRFQSARDVAFGLETVSETSGARPVGTAPLGRARRLGLAALGLLVLANASFWAGTLRHASSDPPTYRRLTFRRGNIRSARFAPDGQTIVYSASIDGRPLETYTTRTDSPESRAMGLPRTRILDISAAGEMALSLDKTFLSGTLARMPLSGGAPREILEGVMEADWSPDGKELAVVRYQGSQSRLEYPISKVVYDGPGYVSHARVSPKGDAVAFIDHPVVGDTAGGVAIVDGGGRKKTLTSGWADAWGLAWAEDGRELWFTAGQEQSERALHAVTLDGQVRIAARIPGSLTLLDASRDGRLLVARMDYREEIRGRIRGEPAERDLSWLDASIGTALSGDGKMLLFQEGGQAGGRSYATYVRKTDGSPAVRLGEGASLALSPDGRWALTMTVDPPSLVLLPTGAGEPRTLGRPGLAYVAFAAGFSPDGKRVYFTAHEKESPLRTYAQAIDGGEPQAIGPEGKPAGAPSPDGRHLVAADSLTSRLLLLPLEGGALVDLRGSEPGDLPIRWSPDGRFLYVRERGGEVPARVFRIEVASGRREPWKELAPADPAGVVEIRGIGLSDDLQSYVYSFRRMLTDLYLVEGVR